MFTWTYFLHKLLYKFKLYIRCPCIYLTCPFEKRSREWFFFTKGWTIHDSMHHLCIAKTCSHEHIFFASHYINSNYMRCPCIFNMSFWETFMWTIFLHKAILHEQFMIQCTHLCIAKHVHVSIFSSQSCYINCIRCPCI